MDCQELSKSTKLWPQVTNALLEKYKILDGVNLHNFDYNMSLLDQRLCQYRSHAFADNERLVFVLNDTEFYPTKSRIGFNITNLLSLLYHLDISFAHCILFTNHHGLGSVVSEYCKLFGTDYPITVFENNYSILQTDYNQTIDYTKTRNSKDIQYHFCFLSNVRRDHRIYLRCYIEDRELLDKTLLSWHPTPTQRKDLHHTTESVPPSSCLFLTTTPWTRINDKIIPTVELSRLYNQHSKCLETVYKNPLVTSEANSNNFDADFLKYSFINLVGETVFDYPYPYMSEKTFKCFWELAPFIIVGAPGSLAYLKQIGFRTFDQWFDESYDQISDPAERLTAIFRIIDIISKWSLLDCQEVYNQMAVVLEHNRQHYIDYFSKELLAKTFNNIKNT